jgi:hypothetical protein
MKLMAREAPDRYEPLPALPQIPAWLWRRTSRAARIAIAVAGLAIVAAAVAVAPNISNSKREAGQRAQRERAQQRAQLARTLEAEQKPIAKRSHAPAPPGAGGQAQLAARARMMGEITSAIAADARARVRRGALDGPIRRVTCERFPNRPGARGADRDLSRRRGRFSCIAVTAAFQGGVLGHQYRVAADFASGRYAFCKITGRAGPEREQVVTIPAACGGDAYRDG